MKSHDDWDAIGFQSASLWLASQVRIRPSCGGNWPRCLDIYLFYLIISSHFPLAVLSRSVHFFACIFYRVKNESAASLDDVVSFYQARGIDHEVKI